MPPPPPLSPAVSALLLEAAAADPVGLLIAGPDVFARRGPTVHFANDAFGRISGRRPADVAGQPLAEALGLCEDVPDVGPLVPVLTALRAGERVQTELRLERPDGSAYWASLAFAPLRDSGTGEMRWTARLHDVTERVQAERTLRASEERYRSLATGHPGIVYRCLYDRSWTTLFVSDAFESVCGWPSSDFVTGRRSFRSLVLEEDVPAVQAAVSRAVHGRQPFEAEYRVRRPDGTVRWLYDEGRVVYDGEGRVRHLDGVMLDVTERHAAEERLRLLEAAVADATESVLITDADFEQDGGPRIVYVNRGFERMSGYTAAEVLGQSPRLLQGPATNREVVGRLRRELVDGQGFFGQTVNYKKDGTPFDIEWSVSPVADRDGHTTHYVAVQRDVTGRRRTERQLRLLRAAVESTQDAVVVACPADPALAGAAALRDDGHVVPPGETVGLAVLYANPAFRRLACVEQEAVVGRDVVELIDGAAAELLEAAASGEARTLEIRLSGNGAPFELAIAPLEQPALGHEIEITAADGDPAPSWWVLTFRDLSATKRAEAESEARARAEEMAQLKSALLTNMSHEIRTPLTAIIGFAEIIAEEAGGEVADFARCIIESSVRLKETLGSVLDLSQLEAGAMDVRRRWLDLATFVPHTAGLLAPLAQRKDLRFDVHVADAPVPGLLDDRHLTRVLQNLIGNAAKFTEHGSICVSVRRDGSESVIEIADTGAGISKAFQSRMFEAFQQESSGIGRMHEGNGLGLSLARHLTELMGGRISVASEIGVGSTFTLRFPLASPDALADGALADGAQADESAPELSPARPVTIEEPRVYIQTA